MNRLTAEQQKRLYESLGTIADALPDEYRRDLYRVCRDRFLWLRDTSETIQLRATVRAHVPDLAMNDWRWVIAVMPDPGADAVLRRWAREAGITRAPIEYTTGRESDRADVR